MSIMGSSVSEPSKKLGYGDYILSLGIYPAFKAYCSYHPDISYNRQCVSFLKHRGLFKYVKRLVKEQEVIKYTLDEIVYARWF